MLCLESSCKLTKRDRDPDQDDKPRKPPQPLSIARPFIPKKAGCK